MTRRSRRASARIQCPGGPRRCAVFVGLDRPVSSTLARLAARIAGDSIPKSVRAERMCENKDVFDFELTDEDMARIAELDTGASLFFDHHDPKMVSWLNGRAE